MKDPIALASNWAPRADQHQLCRCTLPSLVSSANSLLQSVPHSPRRTPDFLAGRAIGRLQGACRHGADGALGGRRRPRSSWRQLLQPLHLGGSPSGAWALGARAGGGAPRSDRRAAAARTPDVRTIKLLPKPPGANQDGRTKRQNHNTGMEDQLPENVLTDILRRLAPRALAISRCVCKAWHTIIDAHRLLRVDLLPHSVGGIFINFHDLLLSEFLSRPSTGPTVSGNFNYLPCTSIIRDHCNGLLLLHSYMDYLATQQYYVLNPATQQWVQLPPLPIPHQGMNYLDNLYLAFDPTLSPHFEVFQIPYDCLIHHRTEMAPTIEGMEWPPSPCTLHVFSTRTKQWGQRSSVREGEAAGTLTNTRRDCPNFQHSAVYWLGVLYVLCQTNFVMRISLSDDKYQIIKPPVDVMGQSHHSNLYMGRSQKGIYCAFVEHPCLVYILDESYGKMKWVAKHCIWFVPGPLSEHIDGPWTLQDINYYDDPGSYGDENSEANEEWKFEWDSDNDNVIDAKDRNILHVHSGIIFLGFHPYKEVVFLGHTYTRGVAYHLSTRKVQDLGNLCPKHYGTGMGIQPFIEGSFPYTPWMGEFPEDN